MPSYSSQKHYIWLSIGGILLMLAVWGAFRLASPRPLSKRAVLRIAKSQPEVRALYALNDGDLSKCLVGKVLKPCESDWVSCIDDAWVVEFLPGPTCLMTQDGRFGVRLLLDAVTGDVISRFPEVDYFEHPEFCREDYECEGVQSERQEPQCLNFIYVQLPGKAFSSEGPACRCYNQTCMVLDEKFRNIK